MQAHGALVDEVLETAGAGHENLDAVAQALQLGAVADPSVDDTDPGVTGEGAQFGRDLLGEFAGG